MSNVNKILLRRSGVRNALAKAESNVLPPAQGGLVADEVGSWWCVVPVVQLSG
ncbi:hypothetical protein AB0H83_03475 [Dactylosporangium sp. NPDC050688]|uniref:hypothetical protein n=1 Tax=Dactylosporangium sp. NPDC050688 TaxID=3157217 RepID=UPI003402CFFC